MSGRRRISFRTRLSLVYGGLFAVTGAALLLIDYVLVSDRLPRPFEFTKQLGIAPMAAAVAPTDVSPAAPGEAVAIPVSAALVHYRESALSTLLTQSLLGLLLAMAVALLLGRWVAGRALRPVHSITATARRLSVHSLDQRIGLAGPRDEIRDLADTFDEMLDRLAASFEAQRRFVANASHELRTPLALQRALIDVTLDDPDAPAASRQLARHLARANQRTEALITGLLLLARSERELGTRASVRLDKIAEDALSAWTKTGLRLTQDLRPVTVDGDPVLLERLVANLLDNAVNHNEPGGWVSVRTGGPDGALTVANSGPVVPASAVEELFEPFRRLSPDRTDSTGSGLGLSIVRAIAYAHGGACEARSRRGGGLVVIVRLPPPPSR